MRLGCKVDHGTRLVLGQQGYHQCVVANVALGEGMAAVALQAGQVFQVARVGELVEVDDRLTRLCNPVQHKIRANKTCAASYQNHDIPCKAKRCRQRM